METAVNKKLIFFTCLAITGSILFTTAYFFLARSIQNENRSDLENKIEHSASMLNEWLKYHKQSASLMASVLMPFTSDPEVAENFQQSANASNLGKQMILYLDSTGLVFPSHGFSVSEADKDILREVMQKKYKMPIIIGPLNSNEESAIEFLAIAPVYEDYVKHKQIGALALRITRYSLENEIRLIRTFYPPESDIYILKDKKIIVTPDDKKRMLVADLSALPPFIPQEAKNEITRPQSGGLGKIDRLTLKEGKFTATRHRIGNTAWNLLLLTPLQNPGIVQWVIRIGFVFSWSSLAAIIIYMAYRTRRYDLYRALSEKDQLTQIGNRLAFDKTLEQIAIEDKFPISMIILDVDGLKVINDSLGHIAGDTHLKRVSELICRSTRNNDHVYRIGGDEFAIITKETSITKARGVLRRIQEQTFFSQNIPDTPPIHLSCGIAEAIDQNSLTTLHARADADMYRHKEAKRLSTRKQITCWLADYKQREIFLADRTTD